MIGIVGARNGGCKLGDGFGFASTRVTLINAEHIKAIVNKLFVSLTINLFAERVSH
jgi:hypothetical protein